LKHIPDDFNQNVDSDLSMGDDQTRVRSKTFSRKQMARDNRRERQKEQVLEAVEGWHPKTRADCYNMPRPCLVVSCRHNLYLDVNAETGSIKLNFPDKEIWELEETCSLDIAERGGVTLEDVGKIMNLTRERIRQLEIRGIEKLKNLDANGEDGVAIYSDFDPSARDGDW